jgi:hypothetical protein
MLLTPLGSSILTPQEINMITMDKESVHFREQVVRLTDSNNSKSRVYRYGRLAIKCNKPKWIKKEVAYGLRLSAISPIFLPILAYDEYSFVYPYVEGQLLCDITLNFEVMKSMSYSIATALLKADIMFGDLHNENVIITHNGFHVIDLEQFDDMNAFSRLPLDQLAGEVLGQIKFR